MGADRHMENMAMRSAGIPAKWADHESWVGEGRDIVNTAAEVRTANTDVKHFERLVADTKEEIAQLKTDHRAAKNKEEYTAWGIAEQIRQHSEKLSNLERDLQRNRERAKDLLNKLLVLLGV